MKEKVLGILGGVGPLATIYFADLVIKMTDAKSDQEHIAMVILNHASIPDRTEYILDNTKPNPLPVMIADAQQLERDDCDYIVIPCNTAHYFFDEIQKSVSVPIINILEEYQSIIEKHGLSCCVPNEDDQKSLMHIIYDQVKAGEKVDICEFLRIVGELKKAGSDAVILGCTELSVIKKDFNLNRANIVDSMECLARASITLCGKNIKADRA